MQADDFLHARCLAPEREQEIALRMPGPDLSVSYGGLAAAVGALADLLGECGIGRGQRIALAAAPSLEFAVGLLAGLRLGSAVAPMDISLRGISLEDALVRLAPDAIIATAGALSRLPAQSERAPVLVACEHVGIDNGPVIAGFIRHGGTTRSFRLSALPGAGARNAAGIAQGCHPADDALLISTSGSTGKPKFVRLGHRGTLFNIDGHLSSLGLGAPFRALQVLGANYSYGLIPSFLAPLVMGGTIVLPPHGDPRTIRATIESERPTVCLATPALAEYLIDACPAEELATYGRLEKIGIGGDACREPVRHKLAQAMPETSLYVTYGATEAGPRITTLPSERFLSLPQAVGLPLPGVDVTVVDENGATAPAGVVGRLRVRTPSRMNGYLGEAVDAAGTDWLSVGDLASLDADGFVTIHGRADRAFKHRGRLLNPSMIESVMNRFPGVIATHVEPLAMGDGLSAVVQCRATGDGRNVTDRLRRHCRRNLPSRLVPQEIIIVTEGEAYFFKGRRLEFAGMHA